ncbi:hypothetical protein WEI85_09905 [Actinomycetes bacterium KLBMP 9797]
MGHEEGDGSGTAPVDYNKIPETTGINVEVTDLVTYHLKLTELSGMGTSPVLTELNEMPMYINDALTMPPGDGISPLPEGVHMAQMLTGRLSDFNYFVQDVAEGLQNIGAAAAVIAEIYNGTDEENGASMGDVMFAFNDPNARRPDGFRPGQDDLDSMYDVRQVQQPLAADPNASTTNVRYENGWAIYTFSDGSIRKELNSGGGYGAPVVKTVEVYGPGNTLLTSTTTDERLTPTGTSQKTVSTTTHSEDGGSSSTSTTTSTRQDGTVTVDTTSTSRTSDGKETTTNSSITATPSDNAPEDTTRPDEGTVEDAQERFDTEGSDSIKEEYGPGY